MAASARKTRVTLALGAFIVSVLALIVSVLVGLSQWQVSKRLAMIEESRRSDEVSATKRARIVARVEHETRPGQRYSDSYVVLENDGLAAAKNVAVDAVKSDRLDFYGLESPIPVLGAGQRIRFGVLAVMGAEPTFSMTVTWEDELGSASAEFTLSIF
jgi:hypothetical protein